MAKKNIKLTEGDLHKIIKKSVNKVLKEAYYTQGDIDSAFNRFQQQGLQQIRSRYNPSSLGQNQQMGYQTQQRSYPGMQSSQTQQMGYQPQQMNYSSQQGNNQSDAQAIEYVEALLDKSYQLLEKYRTQTNDTVSAQVMGSVAGWISQAKMYLDANFL